MAKETEFMLTTVDNPFDPFDDFISWRMYDIKKSSEVGLLPCCEYVAKMSEITDDMNQKERNTEIERVIDDIIKYNTVRAFKKVQKEFEIEEVDLDLDIK